MMFFIWGCIYLISSSAKDVFYPQTCKTLEVKEAVLWL